MNFTKPDITRLARSAGVKSVSEDSFDIIRQLIDRELREVIKLTLIVNSEHQTKTLMGNDVYNAVSFRGTNMTQSSELSVNTCPK